MKLRLLMITALLGLSASAFAANPAPAASTGAGHMMGRHYCEKNAKDCKDQAAAFDKWCGENADKCTELKAFVERHREWCEKNPGDCKEMRENMHKHMQEMCAKNPDMPRCKAMNSKDEDSENDMTPPR